MADAAPAAADEASEHSDHHHHEHHSHEHHSHEHHQQDPKTLGRVPEKRPTAVGTAQDVAHSQRDDGSEDGSSTVLQMLATADEESPKQIHGPRAQRGRRVEPDNGAFLAALSQTTVKRRVREATKPGSPLAHSSDSGTSDEANAAALTIIATEKKQMLQKLVDRHEGDSTRALEALTSQHRDEMVVLRSHAQHAQHAQHAPRIPSPDASGRGADKVALFSATPKAALLDHARDLRAVRATLPEPGASEHRREHVSVLQKVLTSLGEAALDLGYHGQRMAMVDLDERLWRAAERGDVGRVRALLGDPVWRFNRDFEIDGKGGTALHAAAHNGHRDVYNELLARGWDPDKRARPQSAEAVLGKSSSCGDGCRLQ
jgi:hypothetical protein